MRIAIIDDNKNDLESMNMLINDISASSGLSITTDLFSGGREFLEVAPVKDYEMIFLDIYMPDMNGIETARKLRTLQFNPLIVYLTTSKDHYPDAFSVHAYDYLIKPVDPEAVKKVFLDAIYSLQVSEPLLDLSGNVGSPAITVPYSDIVYITADGNYLQIRAAENHRIRTTFSSMCKKLNQDNRFLVINRGILVNLDHVNKMQDYSCIMDTKDIFPLNRRKAHDLRNIFIKWNFDKRNKHITKGSRPW